MDVSNFEGFSWTEEKSSIFLEIMTHLVISKKLDVLAWQSLAVATPSLTPRLSFFPLWMLFAVNAGGGTSAFILGEPAAPLPGGRPACPPSTGR